jgi:pimeloyl-ACP methyl ester carboxylesterase
MATAKTNGINIYYEIHGEGVPLLLIAGLNSDHTFFTRTGLVDALSTSHRVIVFDNRGVGKSDKPDEPYSIEMMAEDVQGLLDSLGIEQTDVLGVSLGGRIAMELAIRQPERVRRLVLVSTGPRTPKSPMRLWISLMLRLHVVRGSVPYYAAIHQRNASRSYDATSQLADIHNQTLILHGKRDHIAPLQVAEEMHSRIPGSKMVTFGGGHLFFILRREPFVEAVEEFLKDQ